MRLAILVTLLLLSGSSLALAATPFEVRSKEDASSDRNIFASTTDTLAPGQWALNNYELVFLGASVGVAKGVQLSATTMLPITADMGNYLNLSAKFRFLETERFALAVMPSMGVVSADSDSEALGGMEVIADLALDDQGKVFLSGGLLLHYSLDSDAGGTYIPFVGINGKVGRNVKLMAELAKPILDSGNNWVDDTDIFLFNYGIRFFGRRLAVDLSFIKPFVEGDTGGLVMGWPYLTFTYRF